jgi:hypothetical protein
MLGWFLDVYVEFLLRIVIRALRTRGSDGWPICRGTVRSSRALTAVYGCPLAEIVYTYRVSGELYSGLHRRPFILTDSNERYANSFAEGGLLILRIKPGEPEMSIVRDDDQRNMTAATLPEL